MKKYLKSTLVIVWMLMIFLSSSIPTPNIDPQRDKTLIEYFSDKSAHLLFFGILSYLIILFLTEFKIKYYKIAYLTILFCFFYGITDEWHQGFTLGRGVSFYDLLFDVIGAMVVVYIFKLYYQNQKYQ
ncbi:MAG: VanZ family protein [bacterium]|nr:VanZ family protein [bacterium]